jgi:hypothetical protein
VVVSERRRWAATSVRSAFRRRARVGKPLDSPPGIVTGL